MRRRGARPQSRPRTWSERSLGSLWPLGSARTSPRRLWAVPGPVTTLPPLPPFGLLSVSRRRRRLRSRCAIRCDAASLRLRPPQTVKRFGLTAAEVRPPATSHGVERRRDGLESRHQVCHDRGREARGDGCARPALRRRSQRPRYSIRAGGATAAELRPPATFPSCLDHAALLLLLLDGSPRVLVDGSAAWSRGRSPAAATLPPSLRRL